VDGGFPDHLLARKTARPGLELAGSRILRRHMLVAINKKMHGRMIRGVCISERAVVRNPEPLFKRESNGFCLHFQLQAC
jgi:hypothetical protein